MPSKKQCKDIIDPVMRRECEGYMGAYKQELPKDYLLSNTDKKNKMLNPEMSFRQTETAAQMAKKQVSKNRGKKY